LASLSGKTLFITGLSDAGGVIGRDEGIFIACSGREELAHALKMALDLS